MVGDYNQLLDAMFSHTKKVLKHVEALCRSFMWSGSEEVTRKSPVAWEDVC